MFEPLTLCVRSSGRVPEDCPYCREKGTCAHLQGVCRGVSPAHQLPLNASRSRSQFNPVLPLDMASLPGRGFLLSPGDGQCWVPPAPVWSRPGMPTRGHLLSRKCPVQPGLCVTIFDPLFLKHMLNAFSYTSSFRCTPQL